MARSIVIALLSLVAFAGPIATAQAGDPAQIAMLEPLSLSPDTLSPMTETHAGRPVVTMPEHWPRERSL